MFSFSSSENTEEHAKEAFGGGRDPSCSYHNQIQKQCTLEDTDGSGERKMVCKTLKQLFERCPGKPMREIERTETEGDAPESQHGFGGSSRDFQEFGVFDELNKQFGVLLDPDMLVNPMQIIEKFFGMPGDSRGHGPGQHMPHEAQPGPPGGLFKR